MTAVLYADKACSESSEGDNSVKMGHFGLTEIVKIVYTLNMISYWFSIILRFSLIMVVTAFVWRLFEPKTQSARILRAAALVLALLVTLAVVQGISV